MSYYIQLPTILSTLSVIWKYVISILQKDMHLIRATLWYTSQYYSDESQIILSNMQLVLKVLQVQGYFFQWTCMELYFHHRPHSKALFPITFNGPKFTSKGTIVHEGIPLQRTNPTNPLISINDRLVKSPYYEAMVELK